MCRTQPGIYISQRILRRAGDIVVLFGPAIDQCYASGGLLPALQALRPSNDGDNSVAGFPRLGIRNLVEHVDSPEDAGSAVFHRVTAFLRSNNSFEL